MKRALCAALCLALLACFSWARISGTNAGTDIWCVGPSTAEVCVDSSGYFLATTDDNQALGSTALRWAAATFGTGTITSYGEMFFKVSASDVAGVYLSTTSLATFQAGTAAGGFFGLDASNGLLQVGTDPSAYVISIPIAGAAKNRVGIGQTSPAYLLDVNGVVKSTGALNSSLAGHSGQIKCIKDALGTEGYCSGGVNTGTGACTCN